MKAPAVHWPRPGGAYPYGGSTAYVACGPMWAMPPTSTNPADVTCGTCRRTQAFKAGAPYPQAMNQTAY